MVSKSDNHNNRTIWAAPDIFSRLVGGHPPWSARIPLRVAVTEVRSLFVGRAPAIRARIIREAGTFQLRQGSTETATLKLPVMRS
jgi:hypothetical protein